MTDRPLTIAEAERLVAECDAAVEAASKALCNMATLAGAMLRAAVPPEVFARDLAHAKTAVNRALNAPGPDNPNRGPFIAADELATAAENMQNGPRLLLYVAAIELYHDRAAAESN